MCNVIRIIIARIILWESLGRFCNQITTYLNFALHHYTLPERWILFVGCNTKCQLYPTLDQVLKSALLFIHTALQDAF